MGLIARASGVGLLGAAAFWPVSLWPLLLVSIALFVRLLRDLEARAASATGFAYGLAFAAGTMHWMFNLFGFFAVFLLAIMAGYFALFGAICALTSGMRPAAPLAARQGSRSVSVQPSRSGVRRMP